MKLMSPQAQGRNDAKQAMQDELAFRIWQIAPFCGSNEANVKELGNDVAKNASTELYATKYGVYAKRSIDSGSWEYYLLNVGSDVALGNYYAAAVTFNVVATQLKRSLLFDLDEVRAFLS